MTENAQAQGPRRSFRRWLARSRLTILVVIWLATMVCGFLGFERYLSSRPESWTTTTVIYQTLKLFLLETGEMPPPLPWELEVARFMAPALTAYATWQVVARVFYEQLQVFRARRMRGHVIVCGLGRKGLALARSLRQQGTGVVAIERDPTAASISAAADEGVVVLTGHATSPEMLRRAGILRASQVIAVCGQDGDNAAVAANASTLVGGREGQALHCKVHIVDPVFCDLWRERWLISIWEDPVEPMLVDFYNSYDSGARALLTENDPFLAAEDIGRCPHVLVVGGDGWGGRSL